MAGVEIGDFGSPDETRTPDKTTVEIVRMGSSNASRMRLEPGWSWSEWRTFYLIVPLAIACWETRERFASP